MEIEFTNKDLIEALEEGEKLFESGKVKEAGEIFFGVLAMDRDNVRALNNIGVIQYLQGDTDNAVNTLFRALEIDPRYRDALTNLCSVLRVGGKLFTASSFLEDLITDFPDDPELKSLLKESKQAAESSLVQKIEEITLEDDSASESSQVMAAPEAQKEKGKR